MAGRLRKPATRPRTSGVPKPATRPRTSGVPKPAIQPRTSGVPKPAARARRGQDAPVPASAPLVPPIHDTGTAASDVEDVSNDDDDEDSDSTSDSEDDNQKRSVSPDDIAYFFERDLSKKRKGTKGKGTKGKGIKGKGTKGEKRKPTVCKRCRDATKADDSETESHVTHGSSRGTGRTGTFSYKTATGTLRGHIFRCHLLEYLTKALEHSWPIQVAGVIGAMDLGYSIEELKKTVEEKGNLKSLRPRAIVNAISQPEARDLIPEFSISTFHQYLVSFIVVEDQAMRLVDSYEFRCLLFLLRDDLQEQDIPHRTKLRELVVKSWEGPEGYLAKLTEDLKRALGNVSFTADIWSDNARRSFLAVTAHWIAKDEKTCSLELKAALIAFSRIRGSHTGEHLAQTVLRLLDRVDITAKTGHFTLDNATNNDKMMQELKHLLERREIEFDAQDRRIMCFPHIINICVKHILDKFSDMDSANLADAFVDAFPDDSVDRDMYLEALERNPIALGRQIVKAIRASSLRRDAFTRVVRAGTSTGLFNVPDYQLLRDVNTRWDSVYYMINRLRVMRPAIDVFLSSQDQRDIEGYRLGSMDWLVLRDFEEVLEVAHRIQQSMSSESRPRLGSAVSHLELFMTAWESKANKTPRLRPYIDVGLKWAKKYYKRMDNTRAYVVAMFVDPSIRMYWIEHQWDRKWVKDAKDMIIELMEHYREAEPQPTAEKLTVPSRPIHSINALALHYGLADMGLRHQSQDRLRSVEEEYYSYITGDFLRDDLDPLMFWEKKRMEYPTIFRMAMDYLPIQASAVPCERVFSSSGETDTERRNRISPAFMEILQMLKFDRKKERLNFTRGWATSQKELLDDEPDESNIQNAPPQHFSLNHILSVITREEGDGIADAVVLDD